jgi:hypothetical protein
MSSGMRTVSVQSNGILYPRAGIAGIRRGPLCKQAFVFLVTGQYVRLLSSESGT